MEHNMLFPLLEVLGDEKRRHPDDLSAANIVAYRLLGGAYLGRNYVDHALGEIAPGEWRMFQQVRGVQELRDPLMPFHEDFFMDYDEDTAPDDVFVIKARRMEYQPPRMTQGEQGIPERLVALADALLERVRQHAPDAVQRLLHPTPEQVAERNRLALTVVNGRELDNTLRKVLGDCHDASLKSYGIQYHHPDHYSHESIYLVAHNQDEVAGLLKLGANRDWSYTLSFVSVAPGFRNQGLSKQLYAQALDLCQRDERVFIRSQPGDFTRENPAVTVGYDKLVKQSAVLHADSDSPLLYLFETLFNQGVSHAQLQKRYKDECDAFVPDPAERINGHLPTWQQRETERAKVMVLLEQHATDLPSAPTRRRPSP